MHISSMEEAETEENYEPDYEPETILIGDKIRLEVLSVVGKSENFSVVESRRTI
jgi:hypothetical protein